MKQFAIGSSFIYTCFLCVCVIAELVPSDFQRDLRHLYFSLLELLKHFWSCFPPTTEELESKLQRMHDTLQRFKMAKLVPFEVGDLTLSYLLELVIYIYCVLLVLAESCHA